MAEKHAELKQNYYCSKNCMGLVGKENCWKICSKCGNPVIFHFNVKSGEEMKHAMAIKIPMISPLITLEEKLNEMYGLNPCPNCHKPVHLEYGISNNGMNANKLPKIYLRVICDSCNREWEYIRENGIPYEVKEVVDLWNDITIKKETRKYLRLADMVLNKKK